MELQKMTTEQILHVQGMVGKRYAEEPPFKNLIEGVPSGKELVEKIVARQISFYLELGEGWITDNEKGLITGHYKKKIKKMAGLRMAGDMNNIVKETLSKEERQLYADNSSMAKVASNIRWKNEVTKGNYLEITMICIDEAWKGQGIFRMLLEKMIAEADEKNVPLLLETHNYKIVPMLQRFGFDVVGRFGKEHQVNQYALKKEPRVFKDELREPAVETSETIKRLD